MSEDPKYNKLVGAKVDRLKQQESQLSSLCGKQQDGIILHDLNGDIIDANEYALTYLGYQSDEIDQLNLKDLQPKTKRGSDKAPIALEIYNDSKVEITRTVFERKDGSRFPADVKTTYVRFNNDGQPITVVQRVFRDLETSKQRAAQTSSQKGVESDINERTDFLSLLKSQLKSPVDDMLSAIKLLGDTRINNEQESLLRLTEKSGSSLISVINDTLDLLKISSDRFRLNNHAFNLSHLVEEVVELMGPRLSKRNIQFTTYIDADIPEYVNGDETRLRQILIKLLHNAAQLTDQGSIKLEVNYTADQRIRFEVIDSGEGIDEEEQQYLFSDDFLQEFSISRKYADVALGYALARRLVIQMDGDFGFSSQSGQGSLFWFSLDLCSEKAKDSTNAKYKFLTGKPVVFIDYADESRSELKRQLKSWGADLHTFDSEEAAAQYFTDGKADSLKPCLVILNLHHIDGAYAALVRSINNYIHRGDHFSDCHFVVITPGELAPKTARHFVRIRHTQVQHPIKTGAFANKLARLICVDEPYEVPPWEIEKAKLDQPTKALDGRILIVDDGIVTRKATSMILKKFGLTVECASNGIEAIEAVEKHHYDVILMDVQMPEMDGIEATKRIRKLENHERHTPILAVTASMEDEVWRDCVYAGMDDYMTKPIDAREMVATIEYWLGTNDVSDPFNIGGGRLEHQPEPKAIEPDSELIEAIKRGEAVDYEIIRQLEKDTSPELASEMVTLFVKETEDRIDRLRTAIGAMNYSSIAEEAHTMISSSSTFGANWLRQLAQALEEQAGKSDSDSCDELVKGLPRIFEQSREQLSDFYQPKH